MIFLFPLKALIWFISCLAETNPTSFDFAEGKSELVRFRFSIRFNNPKRRAIEITQNSKTTPIERGLLNKGKQSTKVRKIKEQVILKSSQKVFFKN